MRVRAAVPAARPRRLMSYDAALMFVDARKSESHEAIFCRDSALRYATPQHRDAAA